MHVLLAIGAVTIIIFVFIRYCKLVNRKKQEQSMQLEVNESVAQYFALAQGEDATERRAANRSTISSSESQN